jgi:DNA-binding transcriptional ArsR family regulator
VPSGAGPDRAASGSSTRSPARAAAIELAGILDTPLFRALAEPARLEVLKVLLIHGGGDVASIAAHLPQDRSVVSRHLQTLEEAKIVTSSREGRHRRYELDGAGLVSRFETLSAQVRALASVCCPPPPPRDASAGKRALPVLQPDAGSILGAARPPRE